MLSVCVCVCVHFNTFTQHDDDVQMETIYRTEGFAWSEMNLFSDACLSSDTSSTVYLGLLCSQDRPPADMYNETSTNLKTHLFWGGGGVLKAQYTALAHLSLSRAPPPPKVMDAFVTHYLCLKMDISYLLAEHPFTYTSKNQ